MNFFGLNCEFGSFDELKQRKKEYEETTFNFLTITSSHKLKGSGRFQKKMVYNDLTLSCKAGKERPSKSTGLRESTTYKKGCPVKVSNCNFILC